MVFTETSFKKLSVVLLRVKLIFLDTFETIVCGDVARIN